ncbi:class I SAM-dependent methyltransferase [Desulfococcaceae bacterium HSG8]|nr:class I SAM-dependent methyltransferase [Desulfococcaceae bacterium HSG8]
MSNRKHHICPVEIAGFLDNTFRRWLQHPKKILEPYIKEGMTVLDVGCGPGFFSVDMAQMVGERGRVIASDLQEGMLQKLGDKIQNTELEERITLHKCENDKIGLSQQLDFILAFYVVHELPDQAGFFRETASILKPDGQIFIAEPVFHVSNADFEATVRKAREAGLIPVESPRLLFSKTVILKKADL